MLTAFLDCELTSIGNCGNLDEPTDYSCIPRIYRDQLSEADLAEVEDLIVAINLHQDLGKIGIPTVNELRTELKQKVESQCLINSLNKTLFEINGSNTKPNQKLQNTLAELGNELKSDELLPEVYSKAGEVFFEAAQLDWDDEHKKDLYTNAQDNFSKWFKKVRSKWFECHKPAKPQEYKEITLKFALTQSYLDESTEAVKLFEKATNSSEWTADTHAKFGRMLKKEDHPKRALKQCQLALQKDPPNALAAALNTDIINLERIIKQQKLSFKDVLVWFLHACPCADAEELEDSGFSTDSTTEDDSS